MNLEQVIKQSDLKTYHTTYFCFLALDHETTIENSRIRKKGPPSFKENKTTKSLPEGFSLGPNTKELVFCSF